MIAGRNDHGDTDACNIEKEIIGLKISQAPRGVRVSAPLTS